MVGPLCTRFITDRHPAILLCNSCRTACGTQLVNLKLYFYQVDYAIQHCCPSTLHSQHLRCPLTSPSQNLWCPSTLHPQQFWEVHAAASACASARTCSSL
jgi:hypothetical protein